jgi:hypothetical protein
MHAIVSARDFSKGTAVQKAERTWIKEVITKEDYVTMLEKSLAILKPIDFLIVKYQSDSVPVSEVLQDFNDLPMKFRSLQNSGHANIAEVNYLVQRAESRYKFMYGRAHGLAFLLDPRFIGQGLIPAQRTELENILIDIPQDNHTPVDQARREAIYMQFTNYVISATKEKTDNTFRFQMMRTGKKSPLQYWQADGSAWPELQNVCVKLFTLATSSASSERNFSTMGFVHSKLRNSLGPDTVEKLVYIKTNHLAMNNKK